MARRKAATGPSRRGRPKAERPLGWGKQYVLDRLAAGDSIITLCSGAVLGLDILPGTLAAEVREWRRTDPEFAAIAAGFIQSRGGGAPPLDSVDHDWKLDWGREYHASGGKIAEASQAVGISASHAYAMTHPGDKAFDPDLARIRADVDRIILAEAAGVVNESMRKALEEGDWRTASWIAFTLLERRDPANWGRRDHLQIEGTVTHEHEHRFTPREKLLAEAAADFNTYRERMREAQKAKIPAELPAHAEGEVLDAEILETVPAEAQRT